MALFGLIPTKNGGGPALSDSAPTLPSSQMLGHTPPAEDPSQVQPRAGMVPLGASGRANFYGLPQWDELNPQLIGSQGLRRFDEMYRTDAHVRRLVLMAWSPIQSGTWRLDPFGGDQAEDVDKQVADTIWWALTQHMSPNLYEHLWEVGPTLLVSGFVPFEQIWAPCTYEGKTYTLPRKLDLRLPRSIWRWWQDDYGELTYIGQTLPNKADVVIPLTEVVYYRLAAAGDNWMGVSLLRHAYKNWYLKDKLERIDAIGQERKAVGVPVVYHSTGIDQQTLGNVEKVLANMHMSEAAYLMLPGPKMGASKQGADQNEWLVDIIKFDSSSGESIQNSLKYHQDAIASSFLGDFMQLGHHQVGARATAQVQEDPFLTAVDGLTTYVKTPLQRLVNRIVELNFPNASGPPTLQFALHDEASLSELATYVQTLVSVDAMQVDPETEDWLRERADMPAANADIRKAKLAVQQAGYDAALRPPEPPGNGDTADQPDAGNDGPQSAAKGRQRRDAGGPARVDPRQLDSAPSARWFDRLLSQDRLKDALDRARETTRDAAHQPALLAAQKLAYRASEGQPLSDEPPAGLVDALTGHYERLYGLGYETVRDELARQRQTLRLDAPENTAAGGALGERLARARRRGEHSARNIVQAINRRLRADTITGLKDPSALQRGAEQTATGQLHVEALDNTSASIADGRNDAAMADGGVVGAFYTSVLDGNTCDPCAVADDDTLLSPDEALSIGPPNPECEGQDRCRCQLVWVLADDPAAVGASF